MGKLIEKMKNARCKATSALMVAGMSAMTTMAATSPAFASTAFDKFFNTVSTTGTNLIGGFKKIATPIAGVAAAYCIVMMLITKDQKKLEGYKQWLISIIVCLVLLYAFPALIDVATSFGSELASA